MRQILSAFVAFALVALNACGGGSENAPVTPPPPAPVASVEVTPASAQVVVGGTTQLTAIARDAAGASLPGRSPTWSSPNPAIATVSAAGTVTGTGAGEVDIAASVEGRSATARVTVALADLQPNASLSLNGTQRFRRVVVPAGVTVTASGALTLTAEDSLIVQGTISGDCVALTLMGGTVVLAGDVRNTCANDPDVADPPALRIISGSSMELGPGITESSGDVLVTNDTTLTDADFPVVPRLAAHAFMAPAVIRGNCRTSGRTWRFPQRNPGRSGQFGGDGRPGRTFRMQCAGDLILANGATIQAQHGANGGAGTHNSVVAANSTGGNGGRGGDVVLKATGSLLVAGVGNEIRTGRGGTGGSSTSNGMPDPGPPVAASATARGGTGGMSGLATLVAGGGIAPVFGPAQLTIVVGDGGNGGEATANGQDGMNAAVRNNAAQIGGDATATGGTGGDTPNKQLVALGAVSLNVGVTGGDAGDGGTATAKGGKGGDASEAHPTGANGGRMDAIGGTGGAARVADAQGALVGPGGDGGHARLLNGLGGAGFSDCVPGRRQPGGRGGRGGTGAGRRGNPNTGRVFGASGTIVASDAGRGGNGGNGQGPGSGGAGGADSLQRPATVTSSFSPGADGQACPPLPIAGNYRLVGTLISITGPNCPTGFFGPTINNPGPIVVTLSGNQVQFQSTFPVTGTLAADGGFSGSGSGTLPIGGTNFTALELIRGVFRETADGGVVFEGDLEYRLFTGGGCTVIYRVTYTRIT